MVDMLVDLFRSLGMTKSLIIGGFIGAFIALLLRGVARSSAQKAGEAWYNSPLDNIGSFAGQLIVGFIIGAMAVWFFVIFASS